MADRRWLTGPLAAKVLPAATLTVARAASAAAGVVERVVAPAEAVAEAAAIVAGVAVRPPLQAVAAGPSMRAQTQFLFRVSNPATAPSPSRQFLQHRLRSSVRRATIF